jgi:hypothetical protein
MFHQHAPHLHHPAGWVYEEQHQRLGVVSRQSCLGHFHMRVGYIDANGLRLLSENGVCTTWWAALLQSLLPPVVVLVY